MQIRHMSQSYMEMINQVFRFITSPLFGSGITNHYPMNILYKHMKKIFRKDYVYINNYQLYLDLIDSLGLSCNGKFEPFETAVMQSLVKPGYRVIDVGANIGYYTILFSRLTGSKGQIYAFEPDPNNFAILSKNIRINHINNCVLYKKAVTDKNNSYYLYLSEINTADHRIYQTKESRASIPISGLKLDSIKKLSSQRIDLIKMDIEGAEYKALLGMKNILLNNRKIMLIFEFWPTALREAQDNPANLIKYLTNLKFNIWEIDEAARSVHPIKEAEIYRKYDDSNLKFTNLIACRAKTLPIDFRF
jgi:FkbM family methyltransferase